jgi:Tol biopolymer transport system component
MAPYLYYYSDLLNAFVIERADGTDSRLLADGVTPDDNNAVRGPGWSPSGKWFAWTSTGGSTSAERPWLISADGTRRFSGLAHVFIGESGGISWSPVDDRLLVVDDTQLWDQGGGYVYYLVDAEAEQIVTSFEIPRAGRICGSAWTPDGQYKMFYRVPSEEDTSQLFLRTVSHTGEISDRKININPVSAYFSGRTTE